MKQWISRLFLLAGFALLLVHNVVAHHHDDDHDRPQVEQHDDGVLEHVQIEHTFSTDHSLDHQLPAIIACLVALPEFRFFLFPEKEIDPPEIPFTDPCPPDRTVDVNVLRGPPSLVNAAV